MSVEHVIISDQANERLKVDENLRVAKNGKAEAAEANQFERRGGPHVERGKRHKLYQHYLPVRVLPLLNMARARSQSFPGLHPDPSAILPRELRKAGAPTPDVAQPDPPAHPLVKRVIRTQTHHGITIRLEMSALRQTDGNT